MGQCIKASSNPDHPGGNLITVCVITGWPPYCRRYHGWVVTLEAYVSEGGYLITAESNGWLPKNPAHRQRVSLTSGGGGSEASLRQKTATGAELG